MTRTRYWAEAQKNTLRGTFTRSSGSTDPSTIGSLLMWLDASDSSTITSAYRALTSTVTGTSGLSTLTCSGDESKTVFANMTIKVNNSEIYTVGSVATSVGITTITTSTPLTASYAAKAIATLGISQWNDKSGNSNNATQGTGASQPTYYPAALNSKNVLTFDGNDSLTLPSSVYSLANGANTIFVVANTTIDNTEQRLVSLTETGSMRCGIEFVIATDSATYQTRTSYAGLALTGITKSNYNILTGSYNGATTQSFSLNNGTAVTNANGALENGVNAANIGSGGASRFLTGGIAEIIIFNRALLSAEILSVNQYLSAKWNIAIS